MFDAEHVLHLQFVAAMACLRAAIFKLKIPSDQPRTDAFRNEIGQMALQVTVPDFVPDDSAAKEIQASVDKTTKKDQDGAQEEEKDNKEDAN